MIEATTTPSLAGSCRRGAHALEVLGRLEKMGVQVAIDDFGTGYSSLAHLKSLPVHELKIDRSFVMQMTSNASDAVIVRTTIDLGRNLGLRVVAEGVEDAVTWQELDTLGCNAIQGYYVSRPIPVEDLTSWLEQQPAATPAKCWRSRQPPTHIEFLSDPRAACPAQVG